MSRPSARTIVANAPLPTLPFDARTKAERIEYHNNQIREHVACIKDILGEPDPEPEPLTISVANPARRIDNGYDPYAAAVADPEN